MLKRGILMLFVLMLSFGFVSAAEITVKTVPFHEVDIGIYRETGGGNEYLELIPENSGTDGIIEKTYNNADLEEIRISIVVEKDGIELFNEKLGPYALNEEIEIELFPDDYEVPAHLAAEAGSDVEVEETSDDGTNETEESNETNEESVSASAEAKTTAEERAELSDGEEAEGSAGITGNVVQESSTGPGSYLYFVIAIVAIFGLLLLSVGYKIKKRNSAQVVQQVPKTSPPAQSPPSNEGNGVAISDAERRIEEAEKNLKKLKEEVKIREMEKRIEQEKAELDRLREGSKN